MSSPDTHEQRIDLLEGRVPDEHLESIKDEASEGDDADEAAVSEGIDVVEALSGYGRETLNDTDEMEAEIARLEEKLATVGVVLPDERRTEVRDTIEALEAASEAYSPLRTNSVEALAERIEVYQR